MCVINNVGVGVRENVCSLCESDRACVHRMWLYREKTSVHCMYERVCMFVLWVCLRENVSSLCVGVAYVRENVCSLCVWLCCVFERE